MKELQLLTQHLSLWRNTGEKVNWQDWGVSPIPSIWRKLTVLSREQQCWEEILKKHHENRNIYESFWNLSKGRKGTMPGFHFPGAILNWEFVKASESGLYPTFRNWILNIKHLKGSHGDQTRTFSVGSSTPRDVICIVSNLSVPWCTLTSLRSRDFVSTFFVVLVFS